jgi:putative ABC transport system permease protein
LGTTLDRQYRPWRVSAILVSGIGALALLLAIIGVYSVIAFAFAERTREMGVRVALGASAQDLVQLVLGSGFRIVGTGVLIGIGLSLALARLAEALVYDVPARDPVSLAGAGAILLLAGVAAALPPALRASRVDPVTVLRED